MVDELAGIGESRRNLRVVARRIAGLHIDHVLGKLGQRAVIDDRRIELREHAPGLAGIALPRERIERGPDHGTRHLAVPRGPSLWQRPGWLPSQKIRE